MLCLMRESLGSYPWAMRTVVVVSAALLCITGCAASGTSSNPSSTAGSSTAGSSAASASAGVDVPGATASGGSASIDPSTHEYPSALVTSFVNACAAEVGMSQAICRCAATAVQQRWTLGAFVALQRALQAGVADDAQKRAIADVIVACVPKPS